MEHITTHHDGKLVEHVAVEVVIKQEAATTPFEYPSWVRGAKCDGTIDGYFYHDCKTTIDAKVYVEHKDAIRCGMELTHDGKPYIIESVECDSKNPFIRVIATRTR